MSQRKFAFVGEQDECHVTAGWDCPLQHYYLYVESAAGGNADLPFYSNLYDAALPDPSGAMTLEQVVTKLEELDIVARQGVAKDWRLGRGVLAGAPVMTS